METLTSQNTIFSGKIAREKEIAMLATKPAKTAKMPKKAAIKSRLAQLMVGAKKTADANEKAYRESQRIIQTELETIGENNHQSYSETIGVIEKMVLEWKRSIAERLLERNPEYLEEQIEIDYDQWDDAAEARMDAAAEFAADLSNEELDDLIAELG
jgi:hypothetical protein